jgi:MoaA/NifB/PqqE/SkfB family radical SAM enzyme
MKKVDILKGVGKFLLNELVFRPRSISLEPTKRCMAQCDFCYYWKDSFTEELDDYVPIIKRFKPLSVVITGGEPLTRKDIFQIIANIKRNLGFIYLVFITNGWLLTLDTARRLREAGIDRLLISLDFMDESHDKARGLKGLTQRILNIAPKLKEVGFDCVAFHTLVQKENLDHIERIIDYAKRCEMWVSLSAYCPQKVSNWDRTIPSDEIKKLEQKIEKIKILKRTHRNILNSDYYLDMIPTYFRHGWIGGCTAGKTWFLVTPDGYIKPCSDLPVVSHYTEFWPESFQGVQCGRCWYACRGELQIPLDPYRVWEVSSTVRRHKSIL